MGEAAWFVGTSLALDDCRPELGVYIDMGVRGGIDVEVRVAGLSYNRNWWQPQTLGQTVGLGFGDSWVNFEVRVNRGVKFDEGIRWCKGHRNRP